jgi:hypothetical protein
MTKDEALKLALKALEYADEMIDTVCVPNSITAIKQALAAPVRDEFDIRGMLASKLTCWNRLRETEANELVALVASLSQPAPVQEPVAWIYSQGAAKVVSMNYVPGVRATPLYTTPPAAQRPDVDALVALARADEREACAMVCMIEIGGMGDGYDCAAAIRARSCPPCNEDCDQGRNCPARKDK